MIKRLFVALFAALTVTGASAQITWAVETGMNFNSLSFSGSSNCLGFFVGPKMKVNIPLLGFGADAAVLYSLNSTKYANKSRSLSYFEIPLNLRYDFDLRVVNLYLVTGPQFNYCLSTDDTLHELYGSYLRDYSRSTWGWNVGGGVELLRRIQLGVTYTIPISNTGSFDFTDIAEGFVNFDQRTVKVRLAYLF